MGGFPAFYNDEAIIPGLIRMGVPIEDARLYSCDGCEEIIIPGKGDFYPVYTFVNFLECLHHTMGMPSRPEGETRARTSTQGTGGSTRPSQHSPIGIASSHAPTSTRTSTTPSMSWRPPWRDTGSGG